MITVRPVRPHDPAVRRLIEALDAYQRALYPPESNHLDPPDTLDRDHVHMVGAFEGEFLLGCGAVKEMPGGYGEIKRMYVRPEARGRGAGRRIMEALEAWLVDRNLFLARLETGIHQREAIGLYEKTGYTRTDPFGAYRPDPLSVFMEKRIEEDAEPERAPDFHPDTTEDRT